VLQCTGADVDFRNLFSDNRLHLSDWWGAAPPGVILALPPFGLVVLARDLVFWNASRFRSNHLSSRHRYLQLIRIYAYRAYTLPPSTMWQGKIWCSANTNIACRIQCTIFFLALRYLNLPQIATANSQTYMYVSPDQSSNSDHFLPLTGLCANRIPLDRAAGGGTRGVSSSSLSS
jgi:hypothetical protein